MALLDELHASGHTIILVTHEEYIADHAGRFIHLKDGMIESDIQNPKKTAPGDSHLSVVKD